MNIEEYYELHGTKITQDSERMFVDDILYPLLGERIGNVVPQHSFLDSSGKSRRIDFVCQGSQASLALEVNGESYHAEGIIPDEMFDDNLYRQNEILRAGYKLARFSYSQLKDPSWRPIVMETVQTLLVECAPEHFADYRLNPTELQREALEALNYYRSVKNWRKAIVVMPTGTGKTIMSALDAQVIGGRILFLVHRLDILSQSVEAYKRVWPTLQEGYLTGDVRENELNCDVLFASKDTLRQPHQLARFGRNEFNYIVVDEVHHGQSPTYRDLLEHFRPDFMLGMTATPVRLDRRDIFELFDYNKAYEVATHDVIERGYLVPYTYHGLRDDIDYSNIRYENNRYRIDDLEKLLVIPERNQAVLNQYLDKGTGDKAIGFCVSIKHAERMAEFFNEQGVGSAAIHSGTENRNQLIRDFRENRITVVFTVDLFNEGVDFPNVQVLLFLRPTESKTVFIQQLGRGLRLVPGKKRVRILDFIGNYKRANLIRDYLAKNKKEIEYKNSSGRTVRKIEYEYSTGCEVNFDATVETILDQQDREELGIGKPELTEAYYNVAEQTGKKPSRIDIDKHGEYRSAQYAQVFGSWIGFIREIGEYTEASYHYPQGTHVGHILAVLWYFGLEDRTGTAFDDKYIRLRGGLGHGRLGTYQRQIKYKLLAAMELGILEDDRRVPSADDFVPSLTPLGRSLRDVMFASLSETNLEFDIGEDEIPSTRMSENEDFYNTIVCTEVNRNPEARKVIYRVIFGMHAIQQMLSFLYQIARQQTIYRAYIYGNFFQAPFVKQYMDREGIVEATKEASRRRCPFLLNLLAAAGLIETRQNEVQVLRFVVFPELVRSHQGEPIEDAEKRLECLLEAWPDRPDRLSHSDLTILKELFGPEFLTSTYMFDEITLIEDL